MLILLLLRVAQQAGDHEALARAELDGRFRAPGGQRRNLEAVDLDAPSFDSSLTSGRTRIEMRPSASTIGVKARPTPYCLYSIVIEPSDCDIGIGNSPPARKLAVSPDKSGQVRLGEGRHQAVVLGEVERADEVEAEQLAGDAKRGPPSDLR